MLSSTLMSGLIVANFTISVVSIFEGNYTRSLYWFGAAIINCAVLWGTK
jgi:hypothetical protein